MNQWLSRQDKCRLLGKDDSCERLWPSTMNLWFKPDQFLTGNAFGGRQGFLYSNGSSKTVWQNNFKNGSLSEQRPTGWTPPCSPWTGSSACSWTPSPSTPTSTSGTHSSSRDPRYVVQIDARDLRHENCFHRREYVLTVLLLEKLMRHRYRFLFYLETRLI